MAASFTPAEWKRIETLASRSAHRFGLPVRRKRSVVIGSFNIRKLGSVSGKSAGAWRFLQRICSRFDLLAVQEVQDDLAGIRHLKALLGKRYGLVVSDCTGRFPGGQGMAERLAFLFDWARVERTEVASDITYDRGQVVGTLFEHRAAFAKTFDDFAGTLATWQAKAEAAKKARKRRPGKPTVELPAFVTFIRQPLCASFRIGNKNPYELLAVNAHLLYGQHPNERRLEFFALMDWILQRAKSAARLYCPNLLVLGDMNLEFRKPSIERPLIEQFLKARNDDELRSPRAAKLNLPPLDVHPKQSQVFRTNARLGETFDQIVFVNRDPRLPVAEDNATAGATREGYDYGVFRFVDLFAEALHGKRVGELSAPDRKALYRRFEHDLTDHLPVWVRLPIE